MISENSIIRKADDFLMSIIDREAVILGIESGLYIGLNEMATEIWTMLANPVKVSEIVDSLANQYDENPILIKDQVIEFLNELLEKSLIKFSNEV